MKNINKLIENIRGYKTYILCSLGLGVVGAFLLGFLDLDTTAVILSALGFGSVATLREAVGRLEK